MSIRVSRFVLVAATAAVLAVGAYACSSSSSDQAMFAPSKGGSGSGGANADASVGGNSGNGGSSGGGLLIDATTNSDQGMGDSACAAEKAVAEYLPLDLYLMVDRSLSMDGTKWTNQSNALKSFFAAPENDGLFLALRFFPLDDECEPQEPNCLGAAYVTPLVDWGQLPGHATDLNNAINNTTANGCFTPTQEALNGVLAGAKQRKIDQPDHVVAAVIVSDGTPCCTGDCPWMTATQLGGLANGYLIGDPPIRTFAIYVDTSASAVLKAIAEQGGTTAPYDATSGSAAFLAALDAIRGSALGCELKFPQADGGKADPKLVQVTYTPDPGGEPTGLKQVGSAADCGGGDGWYYDNATNPTKITLCDATCATVRNDPDGEISIMVGCSQTRY